MRMAVTSGRAFPQSFRVPARYFAAKGRDVLGGFVAEVRDTS